MIEYIIAADPDDRVIERARKILENGGLVCLPTDTNWIAVADPFNKEAVAKLYKLKKENLQKHFSLLVKDISSASEVAMIDDPSFKLLKRSIPGHYTFIFEATKKISKALKASKADKEVGLRFVPSTLINRLLNSFGGALIGTNIPVSLSESYEGTEEIYSYMIEEKLGHLLNMILDPGEFEFVGPSTIVDFSKGAPEVTRVGAGSPAPFI